jgi:hypothetical protein
MAIENLDLKAARLARMIISETERGNKGQPIEKASVENLVTKTLGILEENGVYACMLYLFSRSNEKEKEIAEVIRKRLFDWNEIIGKEKPDVQKNKGAEDALRFVAENFCNDLNTLFLVKELWERTLIYARYGAKARES